MQPRKRIKDAYEKINAPDSDEDDNKNGGNRTNANDDDSFKSQRFQSTAA